MRLFFGLPLDRACARSLARIRKEPALAPGTRWVAPHNYHLTLHFCGEVAESELGETQERGARAAASCGPLEFRLEGLGVFPGLKRARVLWAGLRGQPEDHHSLRELALKLGNDSFQPHLTLGRFRRGAPQGLSQVLEALRDHVWGSLSVQSLHLYQSDLTPSGPIYRSLQEWEL